MILSLIILIILLWAMYEVSLKLKNEVKEIIINYKKLKELRNEIKKIK